LWVAPLGPSPAQCNLLRERNIGEQPGPLLRLRTMHAREQSSLVIFRIGSIGDTVVALPCFHAVARAFPEHRRILLTNAADSARASTVESVLQGTGLIDETLHFPVGRGRVPYSLTLARRLRVLGPEALVYLAPRPRGFPVYRDLVFFRAAGIRRIIGAPMSVRARECTIDPQSGELEYEAVRLARTLGEAVPVDLSPPNWDLRLSAAEQRAAAERLSSLPDWRPQLAVAAGAKIPVKDWGEESWAALIALFGARLNSISLVFVGALDERSLAERLAARWPGPWVNLCGELTPRESAAVLGRCDALVCHDGGAMHLAASQGTRCIGLFGNYNSPHQWFPFGDGHQVVYEPRGVREIRPEQVADLVEATLVAAHARATPRARVSGSSIRPPSAAAR
jgi:heptosyltransferase III